MKNSELFEHWRKIRKKIEAMSSSLSDAEGAEMPVLFPVWKINKSYQTGDRIQFGEFLYKCILNHTSNEIWNPEDAPTLWAKILPGQEDTPIDEWEVPLPTNLYMRGDKARHFGFIWESLIDNNSWEPGVIGTEALWQKIG